MSVDYRLGDFERFYGSTVCYALVEISQLCSYVARTVKWKLAYQTGSILGAQDCISLSKTVYQGEVPHNSSP